ncbi:MAG: acetate--CoA ligase [Crenarchaeota archaeon]|nr:acetate--CoA ligase [Thermoproteota archaeon]MDW8033599.1 acetate--CoA ligase [Nitrososphaerota archaeon]
MEQEKQEVYKEFKEYIIPPSWKNKVWDIEDFKKFHEDTVKDKESIEKWWLKWAEQLPWFKKWNKVLDDGNPPFFRWFVGGEINLAYLCTDWQIEKGRKNKLALIWEGEPVDENTGEPKEVRKFTYYDIYRISNRIAFALKNKLKVEKGEVLTFYLPMIPELPFYMLALQRIGAKHSIVYSGFSAIALADRIEAAGSRIIVTADGLYRRGRIIKIKEIVDEAVKILEERGHIVEKVIVVNRTGRSDVPFNEARDMWHIDLLSGISENVKVDAVPLPADDFSYILYTSGTTGAPKGSQESIGGYAVGLYATMKMIFDIKDDDVYWCTADIGWVTGHSYIVYGPLMTGATSIMYEGAPDYPAPDRWWSIIERYGVTIFYTSPTAIRMLMKFPDELVKKHDLSTIRIAHSVGEPINPEAFRWLYANVCRGDAVCSSTWWMTETGHILTGHLPGLGKIYPLKPGTNGFTLPGVKADVVDEDGKPCPPGVRGYFVIKTPWPGMLMSLYKDPQRYIDVYWKKWEGCFWTGDYAVKDQDGYFWILGRADDVIKVAGHRIGTAEVESAMIMHPAVAESACIGKPDEIKGEIPMIFTVLKHGYKGTPELEQELKMHLRKTIGPLVASDAIIVFINAVPKTRSGKIMRRLLRAVVAGKPLGDITTLEDETAVKEVAEAYNMIKEAIEKRG